MECFNLEKRRISFFRGNAGVCGGDDKDQRMEYSNHLIFGGDLALYIN